jgi:hypothetical protein
MADDDGGRLRLRLFPEFDLPWFVLVFDVEFRRSGALGFLQEDEGVRSDGAAGTVAGQSGGMATLCRLPGRRLLGERRDVPVEQDRAHAATQRRTPDASPAKST